MPDASTPLSLSEPLSASLAAVGEESPFDALMADFDEAARRLGIPASEYAILRKPDREITVSLPLQRDDGSFVVLDGHRVQHNQGLGPFLGPIQIRADLRVDELRAVAGWMTWECAVMGVPFGGAAGGIPVDPASLSRAELERLVRRYVANLLDVTGPERDVYLPDTGTDAGVMAWIMDTVSMHARMTANAAVAGKPPSLGGIALSEEARAIGLATVLELACERWRIPARGARAIIQGAGRVGAPLARRLHERGWKVAGIADQHGGLYSERGLDVPAILAQRRQNRFVSQAEGDFERVKLDELVARPCDALLPCAVANTITARTAPSIQARLIVEGAHGPVSPRAYAVLAEKGIALVPHILANGGGLVSAYFEWVQNRQGLAWLARDVELQMRRFMTEAWNAVREQEERRGVDMRAAANLLAVERVSKADVGEDERNERAQIWEQVKSLRRRVASLN